MLFSRDEEDLGRNAEVEYFLTGGNGSSLFHLDRYSGKFPELFIPAHLQHLSFWIGTAHIQYLIGAGGWGSWGWGIGDDVGGSSSGRFEHYQLMFVVNFNVFITHYAYGCT